LKGVTRWAGRASRAWQSEEERWRKKRKVTLERRISWSWLHSHSTSSAFELFQLSVLFRFGGGGTNTEFEGDPQLRGVRGDP